MKKAAKHLRLVLSWRETIGTGEYYSLSFSFLLYFVSLHIYTLHFVSLYDFKHVFFFQSIIFCGFLFFVFFHCFICLHVQVSSV